MEEKVEGGGGEKKKKVFIGLRSIMSPIDFITTNIFFSMS